MKWLPEQVKELRDLCLAETDNTQIANYFGVPVTEIYAKRSQMGITIPKVKAVKMGKTTEINAPSNTADLKGLETFINGKETCIVLARSGSTALIVIPERAMCQFVVPLEHKPGASDWWQGHYFESLEDAFNYYHELTKEEI